MKNIIIGTAGHIDHGKTTLIKSLTEIDTDRLKEEKKRGITIDLGFAFFNLPSGRRAGIVDVPGHEKFIKNMLAGVSGIDIVMLIISAEEGVMPQTREHLDILDLLDVKKGMVVITKKDMVDEEWLSMITEDIKEKLEGSFLEKAPIVAVDSMSRNGFDKLIEVVDELSGEVEEKSSASSLRMPIDRVFTLTGHGTVVTGTLIEGSVNEGDDIMIYPSMKESRVRSIQVHGESVKKAYAGQRVAINLTLKKSEVNRGEILSIQNTMEVTSMLDVKLKLLPHSIRELTNWTRLRLFHGTKEIMCRLVLLDREVLKPGEECFAQLRLEEPTATKYGDRFVIRFYSPLETIGGGVILDPVALKHKRFKQDIIDELISKDSGKEDAIIENLIEKNSKDFLSMDEYIKLSGLKREDAEGYVNDLIEKEIVYELSKKVLLHKEYILKSEREVGKLLNDYHIKYPFRLGMPKEELRAKMFSSIKMKVFDEVIKLFSMFKITGMYISLEDFKVEYSKAEKEAIDLILDSLNKDKFKPMSMDVLIKSSNVKHIKDIITNLTSEKKLIKISNILYLTDKTYEEAKNILEEEFKKKDSLSLADCRDALDTSRKYIVPIMEHFDEINFTKRVGDERVLV